MHAQVVYVCAYWTENREHRILQTECCADTFPTEVANQMKNKRTTHIILDNSQSPPSPNCCAGLPTNAKMSIHLRPTSAKRWPLSTEHQQPNIKRQPLEQHKCWHTTMALPSPQMMHDKTKSQPPRGTWQRGSAISYLL